MRNISEDFMRALELQAVAERNMTFSELERRCYAEGRLAERGAMLRGEQAAAAATVEVRRLSDELADANEEIVALSNVIAEVKKAAGC